jgi:hypothetical protein
MYVCVYVCRYVCMCVCVCYHICSIHTQIRICVHTYIHTYNKVVYVYTHTYIHTGSPRSTRSRGHMQSRGSVVVSSTRDSSSPWSHPRSPNSSAHSRYVCMLCELLDTYIHTYLLIHTYLHTYSVLEVRITLLLEGMCACVVCMCIY